MSSKRPKKIIPKEEVPSLIVAAKDRARDHLRSAELLANNPECANDAGLLTIYALEEIGKAAILQRRFEEAQRQGDTFIQIKGKGDDFYNHPAKINAALNAMPNTLKTLTMGTFSPNQQFFPTGKMEISQDLKEHITYAEYKDGKIIHPHILEPVQVANLIQNLRTTFL